MTLRPCRVCGIPTEGSRCPAHVLRRGLRPQYGWAHQKRAKALYGQPCVYCGRPADTADHLVPVALDGSDGPLVPACRRCNCKKGARV
jgi:5-methylcytosine-specific restriction endonuclease McrA